MLKQALLIGVVVAIAARLYGTLIRWGIHDNGHFNHEPGKCKHVKGFDQGSEDMILLADDTVITSHGLGHYGVGDESQFADIPGQLSVFDMKKPDEGAKKLTITKSKGLELDLDRFRPHGLGHFNDGKQDLIFVVNHPKGTKMDTVEKFSYDPKTKTLLHVKTYEHHLFYSLNDVAVFGPDSFYATNVIYFFHQPLIKYLEVFLDLPLSNTVLYTNGDARVVTNAVLMNGVNLSRDKKYVYIAQVSPSPGVGIYQRLPNNDLKFVKHYPLGRFVDNIEVLKSGDLVIGTQLSGIKMLMKMLDEENKVCPSQVLYIRMKNAETPASFTSLLLDDGRRVNGASIATLTGKHLLIGTFHDQMMYCTIDVPY